MKVNIPLTLMQGLYYPAALGTGLVLLVLRVAGVSTTEALGDVRNWYALLLLSYFSLSFISNQRWAEHYGWALFGLDVAEVVVILAAFKALGFLDGPGPWQTLRRFYLALMIVPILHGFWNLRIGARNRRLSILHLARLAVLGVGATFLPASSTYAWCALVVLFLLTIWYTYFMYVRPGQGAD